MPRDLLSKEQIVDLLQYIDVVKIGQWKDDDINFCCPIHGESNPSCGINSDYVVDGKHSQVFHCFSCGASGNLAWFLHKSLPDKFRNVKLAENFIKSRYDVDFVFNYDDGVSIKRYEDCDNSTDIKRYTTPYKTLAPFKSGKETYSYFLKRGFTKEEMKEYMIGRDLTNKTITLPIFWEDRTLVGVLGRYIDPNRPKNKRFKIYDFPIKSALYPLDKVEPDNGVIILVESILDVILLRRWGYLNAMCSVGDDISKEQIDQLTELGHTVIHMYDNDSMGRLATKRVIKKIGKRMNHLIVDYPSEDFGKDPDEWGELVTVQVISSAHSPLKRKLPRI